MRIKVAPDDFVVEEIVDIRLSGPEGEARSKGGEGAYRIYLLEKVGWNTLDAIRSIASASGVEQRLIGYAGLKDRHARTSQHISVPARYELVSRRPDIRLTLLGFSDDFVSTKVLVGNRFVIRMGGLSAEESEGVGHAADEVRRRGFPNYFDDQRFGSVTQEGDFMAERLAKGHLKGALKIHLCSVFPTQKKEDRERRARMAEVWGDWSAVLALCETAEDKAVAAPLVAGAGKKNLLRAVNAIPREAMARYIAAYQAFIWNEVLRRLIRRAGGDLAEYPGKCGLYVFGRIPLDLDIPAVSARLPECPPGVYEVIEEVLSERGITPKDLSLRGVRSGYFKSFLRKAAVVPRGLTVTAPVADTDDPELREVTVSFELPAGSYATMLLKALLAYQVTSKASDDADGAGKESLTSPQAPS